jgi:competence protein ComEC
VDRTIAAGDQLHLDGADITVRWPLRGKVPLEPPNDGTGINNVSIVLDLRYGTRRFLLTGDVEQQIDPQLLLNGIGNRTVDVLKVPHHGSGTATTDALLAALRPRIAIVSAGIGNPYGHPNRRTLERIAAAGARVLRTDRDGSVTVTTDGTDLQISSTGARAAASVMTGAPTAASLAAGAVPALVGWSCGIAAAEPTVPTIPGWSRIASNPPPFFSPSGRPAGSSPTSARPPRWPASSRSASPAGETTTARSSKPPLSFTTSTSSFLRTGRSPAWSTVRPVLAG